MQGDRQQGAAAIGAVNALRREPDGTLVGAMLDGKGFVRGIEAAGISLGGAPLQTLTEGKQG